MAATCAMAPVPCRLARTARELLLLPLLLLPPVVVVFLLVLEVVEPPDVPVVGFLLVFLELVAVAGFLCLGAFEATVLLWFGVSEFCSLFEGDFSSEVFDVSFN